MTFLSEFLSEDNVTLGTFQDSPYVSSCFQTMAIAQKRDCAVYSKLQTSRR